MAKKTNSRSKFELVVWYVIIATIVVTMVAVPLLSALVTK